jgi:hypothetical protein
LGYGKRFLYQFASVFTVEYLSVVDPRENYRGLPYGFWASLWCKWILSEDPDLYRGDMMFLRGNVDYRPVGGVDGAPIHIDAKAVYERTGKDSESIFVGTPIFFPVVNAVIVGGHTYDGKLVKTEDDMRYVARRDIFEGGDMWATIKRVGRGRSRNIVRELHRFLVESPIFHLRVPRNSKLRTRMEDSLRPGVYECVTVGYYLLMILNVPSNYRIRFGGQGRGIYRTDAIYDINVLRK